MRTLLETFRSPPADCTQIPFWFLNGPVDGREYCRQIDQMAAHGVKQAMPHPRFGMDRRDYLEDRYWQAFTQLADHATERGFTLHLYDEYNWSSGPAGGRVTADRGNCALGMGMRAADSHAGGTVRVDGFADGFMGWGEPESVLGVCRVPLPEDGILDLDDAEWEEAVWAPDGSLQVEVPVGAWRIMVFYTVRTLHPSPLRMGNGGIIDYLAPEPTRRFIELTHEEYARRFGDRFGSVIPSIFYDESAPVACGPFTWTDGFQEAFRKRKGYELLPLLPCLFADAGPRTPKVRCDYWDTVSSLFAENHIGQLADWCAQRGLALAGHTFEEPERWLLAADLFHTLRRQHWPGLDSLGGYKPYHFHKPAAGAAHVSGSKVLLCEALGLLGHGGLWHASPRMIREGYNQLSVVGVTHVVPHAFFQTLEHAKVECPPCFFEHNPYWKYYDTIAGMTARQCWLNRQGRHHADVAVLYPIVSWWGDAAGGRGSTYPWQIATRDTVGSRADREAFERIVDGLMAVQLDHDVIDSQALSESSVADGRLRIADESFRVLVLPPMQTARLSDLSVVSDFLKKGGVVVVAERWPEASMEHGRGDARMRALVEQIRERARFAARVEEVPAAAADGLERDVTVREGEASALEISHRSADPGDLYVVSHHGDTAERVALTFRCKGDCGLLDPETGDVYRLDALQGRDGVGVELYLESQWAPIVLFAEGMSALPPLPPDRRGPPDTRIGVPGPWAVVPVPVELDTKFGCDVGEQVVEVAVFRSIELSHQDADPKRMRWWREWFRPEFDDAAWPVLHCARAPLLFSHTGSRLFRTVIPPGAHALKLPLPIEKEYALYLNGERLRAVTGHDDVREGWLELPASLPERAVLAVECASMAPDFGIRAPFAFRCAPVETELRSWVELGLWWYSGRALYRREIEIPRQPGKRIFLNLGDVRECAEIWVNGRLAGVRLWPPYRVDITDLVRPGSNDVRIVASNLLANRFAWDQLGTRGWGLEHMQESVLDSGVLGPVNLDVYGE